MGPPTPPHTECIPCGPPDRRDRSSRHSVRVRLNGRALCYRRRRPDRLGLNCASALGPSDGVTQHAKRSGGWHEVGAVAPDRRRFKAQADHTMPNSSIELATQLTRNARCGFLLRWAEADAHVVDTRGRRFQLPSSSHKPVPTPDGDVLATWMISKHSARPLVSGLVSGHVEGMERLRSTVFSARVEGVQQHVGKPRSPNYCKAKVNR